MKDTKEEMKNPSHYQLRDFHKALNADIVKKAKKAGGTPAWLKDFAGQLEDPEYAALTLAERGLLKDLRLIALRRDNKIPNDEAYLCRQLRCSPRTRLVHKLSTLRTEGFLEVHPEAYELPANEDISSRTTREQSESQVLLDKKGLEQRAVLTALPGGGESGEGNGPDFDIQQMLKEMP